MKLTRDGGVYVLESTFAEREAPKQAGFRWDPQQRRWWTNDPDRAARLAEYGDDDCRDDLLARRALLEAAISASHANTSTAEVPAPDGFEYLPFQRAGIAYAMERPAVLLGDEMGLGKTIQALGLINADGACRRSLVVCPATLRANWRREAERWLTRPTRIDVVAAGEGFPAAPDDGRDHLVVLNYDILHKHQEALRASEWDLVVLDEAHYCKNPNARRTEHALGTEERVVRKRQRKQWYKDPAVIPPIPARRRLYLTGTPIVNRPVELWPLVHSLDPARWTSFWSYARRYCAAHYDGYGYKVDGADHLDELQARLRASILVRRLKADVLTELPPKRRQVIEMPPETAEQKRVVAAELAAWARHEATIEAARAAAELAKAAEEVGEYEKAVERLKLSIRVAFTELAALRHATAVAKAPTVVAMLHDLIDDDPERKLVVFAHHLDVIRAIAEEFGPACVTLTGETPMAERQGAVDRFQTEPAVRVFVGGLHAAGVGITLTAAAHVVFAELDWTPGVLTQAEDRCHRIGQAASVLVQHLVLEGSLDARMARILVEKQRVIDAALNGAPAHLGLEVPVVPSPEPASGSTSRAEVEKAAALLSPEAVAAIHQGLRILAGVCDGAAQRDDVGFNRMDTMIGHSLANAPRLSAKQAALGARLLRKYHRQLPDGLLEAAGSAPAKPAKKPRRSAKTEA